MYESNPTLYVRTWCAVLFGESMRRAGPFKVVFNEVHLWSKPKIKSLQKVC